MPRVAEGPVIALIDGEHHPAAVRDVLTGLDSSRGLAGVVFCGGEEKLGAGALAEHYGRAVETDPEHGLRRLAPSAAAVVDLADEPVVPASRKLALAALSLHLGLAYEAPGLRLTPPRYAEAPGDAPKLAVIGTGKRTGKTAVAGHWAALMRERGVDPVIVCMGRGGPAEPRAAAAGIGLEELLDGPRPRRARGVRLPRGRGARRRAHGRLPAGGRGPRGRARRVERGRGRRARGVHGARRDPVRGLRAPASRPWRWTGPSACSERARPSPSPSTGCSGRTSCWPRRARPRPPEPCPSSCYPSRPSRCRPAPAWPCSRPAPSTATEWSPSCVSTNLARRGALAEDLERAAREGCDLYLTELKAAAIDTVARRAVDEGARVVFVRNRPVGIDDALLSVCGPWLRRSSSTRATACPTPRASWRRACPPSGSCPSARSSWPAPWSAGWPSTQRTEVDVETLNAVCEDVLLEEEGAAAVSRFRAWSRLGRLERPLVVLIGGTTGVGKSTLATMLAARLGITRVIATDVIRQVLRAFFTAEAMPSVHHSAFDAGGLEGLRGAGRAMWPQPRRRWSTGPPTRPSRWCWRGCTCCPAPWGRTCAAAAWSSRPCSWWRTRSCTVATSRTVRVRGRRSATWPPSTRSACLQVHLAERARAERVAVIDNASVDVALGRLMQLVLGAVDETGSESSAGRGARASE